MVCLMVCLGVCQQAPKPKPRAWEAYYLLSELTPPIGSRQSRLSSALEPWSSTLLPPWQGPSA